MRKGDNGKKVLGVILILAIIVAVFSGVVLAEDLSGGLKQSVDDAEIQTAVGNLSSEELAKALDAVNDDTVNIEFADQSAGLGVVSSRSSYDPQAAVNYSDMGDWCNYAFLVKGDVTLTLYVHEGSASGPVLSGARVTGQDGAGNSFDKTTGSSGYVTITGTPGSWQFTASKTGYQSSTWSQSITTTCTRHAFLEKDDVTLTLYVHEGSASGPVLSGARVTGQDGAGNSFDKTTGSSGYVTITGTPGNWQFTASKTGYQSSTWTQSTTTTCTRHAFLEKDDVTLTLYVHEGSASGPVLSGARVTGQDGAGNSFDKTTGSSGYVTITGTPGSWQFTASKTGYQSSTWTQSTTTTCTRHAFLEKDDVTLTLYVHEGSASGPVLSGARVTGQDGAGNSFDKTTGSSGYVTIIGTPGNWQFTASKTGYQSSIWSQSITTTCERHAFLEKDDVTLTLYVHEGSASGPVLSGARVTGQDGAGNSFDKTTGSSGYVTIIGTPGNWQFTASKTGYQSSIWSQSITTTCERHAFLEKDDVTLTLYVREGSETGPVLSGARVTAQDGAGNSFDKTTGSSGYVTIIGTPGNWQFTASKTGYQSSTWSQSITTTCERHAFLEKDDVTLTLYVREGSETGPVLSGARVTGQDGAGNSFDETTGADGYVVITGASGTWHFRISKTGYKPVEWDQSITTTCVRHAYFSELNQPPNKLTMLFQLKSDGVTLIPVGCETTENSVTFKGVVSDPDGDHVKLQVELRRLDEYGGQFDETQGGFKESGFLESGSEAVAYANELIDADYHWRARTVDEHGDEGEWKDFGNNDILDADFIVSSQNQPPNAFFTSSPQSPKAGEEATLDASNSYDPDGREIKFYEWDLDGDDSYNGFTTSPEIYYYWSDGGTYSVRLRVTDNVGATGIFVKEVIVQQNSWWEKIKKFFAPKVETLSGSEKRRFEMIKSELHISNYPHSENPSSDSDFYWISDDQLLTVLKKVIEPEAGDLTYETYIIDILHDMKLADSIAKRSDLQNPVVEEYFENMAEINGWAVAGGLINEALIEAVIIEAGGGIGIGPILMFPDLCQAGIGLTLLADTRYRYALRNYFELRENDWYSSEEAFYNYCGVPLLYSDETTREYFEKLWIEYGGSHISDNGGLKRDFQEQVINELRTVLLYGIEKYKFEPCQLYHIKSPGEVRVYDSQGRVTGSINGELSEEIPNSAYDDESKKLLVFNATDSYFCQVVGTDTGTYGLDVTSIEERDATTFTATNVTTSTNAAHQYTIDWEALSEGEEGVTIQIDSNGDGTFEQNITTDDTFHPPIASFFPTTPSPVVGEEITFNAASSYDPDGTITKYEWNFGDGNTTEATEPIITHSYVLAGEYTVNLTVTDDDGATGTNTTTITVSNPPDLVITAKWLCWPDNCTICYNVTNTGTRTAPAGHNTTLYVDDVAVAHDHVPVDLAPGESYIGCFGDYTWTYTPPSDNITVCADNNESIVELNEDNNCLTNIWMCGDVTGDGRVRTSDGRRIFRHLTFGDPIDNLWAADVTGDGRVRTSDGRRIFRHLTFGDPLNCNCSG